MDDKSSGTSHGFKGLDLRALYDTRLKPLQILLCGKTGAGKSTLINSFFGCKVVEVNDPGLKDGNLSAGTTKVESRKFRLGEILVDIFDSPGLQSDEDPKEAEKYLQDIYEKCKDVDLFLYCLDMTSPRFAKDDIATLQEFNKRFGESFWKRCVLVLTKANLVHIPVRPKGKEREYHQRLYQTILSKFREELGKVEVSDSVRNAIPACAAGVVCDMEEGVDVPDEIMDEGRFIWYLSDKAELSDRPVDFLGELWVTCIERLPAGPSRAKLMNCNDTIYTKKPIRESKEVLRAKEEYERKREQDKREMEKEIARIAREREQERREWEMKEKKEREERKKEEKKEREERKKEEKKEREEREKEEKRRREEREKLLEEHKEIPYKNHSVEYNATQYSRMNQANTEQFDYAKFVLDSTKLGASLGMHFDSPVGTVVGGVVGVFSGLAIGQVFQWYYN